jgi:hypothetical protein
MDNQYIIEQIRKSSTPLQSQRDLLAIVDTIGDAKIVLLGEASHGTSEFYTLRTELTKLLKFFPLVLGPGEEPSLPLKHGALQH